MQYAIFYSPYLWERRPGSFRALSVTVGTSLTAVQDNVMFGVSYELPRGVTLHSGLHFGRVTTVDPRLGVAIDGSVNGVGLSDVPTTSSWQRGWFYTVGLDPRILGQLFRVGAGAAVPDR